MPPTPSAASRSRVATVGLGGRAAVQDLRRARILQTLARAGGAPVSLGAIKASQLEGHSGHATVLRDLKALQSGGSIRKLPGGYLLAEGPASADDLAGWREAQVAHRLLGRQAAVWKTKLKTGVDAGTSPLSDDEAFVMAFELSRRVSLLAGAQLRVHVLHGGAAEQATDSIVDGPIYRDLLLVLRLLLKLHPKDTEAALAVAENFLRTTEAGVADADMPTWQAVVAKMSAAP